MGNKKRLIIIISTSVIVLVCSILLLFHFLGKRNIDTKRYNLFVDGKIIVEKDGKYGYLNRKGKVEIDFLYDYAEPFYKGVAVVCNNDKYFLIDEDGRPINNNNYDYLEIDHNSDKIIFKRNDKFGIMTLKSKIIVDTIYDNISYYSEGLARVRNDNKYGYVNEKGKMVIECKYDWAGWFSEDYAVVEIDDKYGYINKKGELVISNLYDDAYDFYNGYAIVEVETSSGNNYKVIDKKGKTIYTDYDYISRTKNCFVVEKDDSFSIINKKGNITGLSSRFEYASGWNSGGYFVEYVFAEDDDNLYLLDEKGILIYSTEFDKDYWSDIIVDYHVLEFLYAKQTNSKLIIISSNGKTLEYAYTEEDPKVYVENNKIIINKNEKFGVIDFKGNTLVDFNYDSISISNDDYVVVEVNGKYGVIDLKGNIIIPIQYDDIPVSYFYYYLWLKNIYSNKFKFNT